MTYADLKRIAIAHGMSEKEFSALAAEVVDDAYAKLDNIDQQNIRSIADDAIGLLVQRKENRHSYHPLGIGRDAMVQTIGLISMQIKE